MKLYAIIETNNNRLICFSNSQMDIEGCYILADVEFDETLIGKKYNNGIWEDILKPISDNDKFTSAYAKSLGRV